MPIVPPYVARLARDPLPFLAGTLKAFRANQGLLLAGAVAYYSLLSIVPLLILVVIALSHFVDRQSLLLTLGHYLEWLVPGQSGAVVGELDSFPPTARWWAGCCWPRCCSSARWRSPCWRTRCR